MHNSSANALNEFFASIHTSNLTSLPLLNNVAVTKQFVFGNIDGEEIIRIIRETTSNAIGHDEIPPKFFKLIAPFLANIIAHIFNFSLKTCTFPEIWNKIIIKPIGKVSEPKEITQTRPISNNSVLTKIFTAACNEQIKKIINKTCLLTEFQSGFRNGHSCATALIRVSEDIKINIAILFIKINIAIIIGY